MLLSCDLHFKLKVPFCSSCESDDLYKQTNTNKLDFIFIWLNVKKDKFTYKKVKTQKLKSEKLNKAENVQIETNNLKSLFHTKTNSFKTLFKAR